MRHLGLGLDVLPEGGNQELPPDMLPLHRVVSPVVYAIAGGLIGKYALKRDPVASAALSGGVVFALASLWPLSVPSAFLLLGTSPVIFIVHETIENIKRTRPPSQR